MRLWRDCLSLNVVDLSYREAVNSLEQTARHLIGSLSLPWDENCLQYYRVDSDVRTASHWQVRQPIYRHSLNRWKNYQDLSNRFCEALTVQRRRYDLPDSYSES